MENVQEGFYITQGKGFQVEFSNGYRVSVQFGWGNYCENKRIDEEFAHLPAGGRYKAANAEAGKRGCSNAETAVFNPDGELIELPYEKGDTVQGWQTPDEVLRTLNWARGQE